MASRGFSVKAPVGQGTTDVVLSGTFGSTHKPHQEIPMKPFTLAFAVMACAGLAMAQTPATTNGGAQRGAPVRKPQPAQKPAKKPVKSAPIINNGSLFNTGGTIASGVNGSDDCATAPAISGSGNSPNVINAVQWAADNGLFTVGFSGFNGGKLKSTVDLCVHSPVLDMEIAENTHMVVVHLVVSGLRAKISEAA